MILFASTRVAHAREERFYFVFAKEDVRMNRSPNIIARRLPGDITFSALPAYLVLLLAFLLLPGCNESGPAPATTPGSTQIILSASAARGAALYTDQGCVKCHGSDGKDFIEGTDQM